MKTDEKGKSVLLCGLPGSGKSETGKELARLLNLPFIDLDGLIEENHGKTIVEIFTESGETHFREIEADILEKLLDTDNARIIALGGGTLETERAWHAIEHSDAITVWLLVGPAVAARRLENNDMISSHPLLKGLSGNKLQKRLRQLLEQRRPDYESSLVYIDANSMNPAEAAARIADNIEGEY